MLGGVTNLHAPTLPWPQVLPILKPTEKCWQPQDFLPNPEAPEFLDAVRGCLGGCPLGGWVARAHASCCGLAC